MFKQYVIMSNLFVLILTTIILIVVVCWSSYAFIFWLRLV